MPVIDGYRNIHHVTASETLAQIQLSKGINPVAEVRAPSGRRRPAILIRSSPWKAGTTETPWHDVFDLDHGHVCYYGDHRSDHTVPVGSTPGNAVLLDAFAKHQALAPDERAQATPLLLFAAVSRNNTSKGYVEFCGVAVIEHAEQIEHEVRGLKFPNYRYELTVFDLSAEDDQVDWAWIEARGRADLSVADTLEHAPLSWCRWVEHGHPALSKMRRHVSSERRHQASRRDPLTDSLEQPGLFPPPRQPLDTLPAWPEPDEPQRDLTASMLVDELRNLEEHRANGRQSRHKSLTLLWSVSRVAAGKPRLARWSEFRNEVGELLVEFDRPESHVSPEYPFWQLQKSRLWHVEGFPTEAPAEPHAAVFDRFDPAAGLTEQAARLLDDAFVRSQAVAILRETHLADIDHHALMTELGLAGYESASGVPCDAGEQETEPRPRHPTRRMVTLSRIVRDPELAARVKRLHDDRCQVCDLQLQTRFGTYSEAAHVRGLGHPHNGPDELSNLLVLCPNHHVQFDALAIYVDADDTVRTTVDDKPMGQLRRHPAHRIDKGHLRYHRALCGRDRE
ncbi:HNH endonuclease [Streptomyces albus]|uniref:HNH endonuclease n=1 Tax=Streptomyces albus TaxID=1888 RepID=UPI0036FEEE0D